MNFFEFFFEFFWTGFFEEFFGRNSLFTLELICQDLCFCQDFVSRQKEGRKTKKIFRSASASISHIKKVRKKVLEVFFTGEKPVFLGLRITM